MITFERVDVTFGDVAALERVELRVAPGELCVLVGPSGSGKSTLLRLVNRLIEPTAGTVRVRGDDVMSLDPAQLRRSIGYVIQSIGLFPHRSVAENIATVPRLLGWPAERIRERVDAMLSLVRLDPGAFADRRPSELSGGQAQRVGLARALAGDPDILLMDEPFGAVDPIVRRELRAELRRIHQETGKTIMLVTHDPAEAFELATRIVVMQGGRVVAAGTPDALLQDDADPFVRELVGSDIGMRRLELTTVGEVLDGGFDPAAPGIADTASLGEALSLMVETRSTRLGVVSAEGAPLGSVDMQRIVEEHP
jgi:osmoprotectant transport system ATP-binding protein